MKKFFGFNFLWIGILCFLTVSLGTLPAKATELTVALYPYVPDIDQFETAIETQWHQAQPHVSLNFIDDETIWDGGYYTDPPDDVDVYVFDAMFFEDFRSQNFLEALSESEVDGLNDFVQYAIEGVRVGQQYLAIPQLGCANILFYQKDDQAIVNATNLTEIDHALNQCTYTSEIPPIVAD